MLTSTLSLALTFGLMMMRPSATIARQVLKGVFVISEYFSNETYGDSMLMLKIMLPIHTSPKILHGTKINDACHAGCGAAFSGCNSIQFFTLIMR
ncbi:exported hypothetical protein [Xenorhabdus bovienii str. puntauvense]|uniref:Uncharacterized protein n=1 Tax=Xenorhabdus bovienii str. puntauvense TaxID=1398201 RepID=A0A077NE49_XENBV|nr:exported hypothetical protein [Xenorhabdus bovienii str. puntauvense]